MNIPMSDSDALRGLLNISYNVRYTNFVLGTFWENFTNKWLQVVFTDWNHQTIFPRDVVQELGGISVDVSQKDCVHTVGDMK